MDILDIVKINCPSAAGLLSRNHLFECLDNYDSVPVTWLTAPAGSGKTSLVTSYLAHRKSSFIWYQCDSGDRDIASFFYYLGLAAQKVQQPGQSPLPLLTTEYQRDITKYSRNYFEKLYLRLETGSFIIFDNYQEIDTDSALSELLSKASENVPEGLRIIFISRSDPPQSMARLQLHNRLAQIDGEDFRLTREETTQLVSNYVEGHVDPEVIDTLHARCQGWMAGVILILNQQKGQRLLSEVVHASRNEVLFDYFAGEIFQSESPDVQNLLLSTAFLPEFTEDIAQVISGNTCAEKILRRLLRNNFFISNHKGNAYQYHPLFRDFLISRAENMLDIDMLGTIKRRSADLLHKNGKTEEAATLFATEKDYPSLIRIICKEAPDFVQRGLGQTLQSWIDAIPAVIQKENPWVLYWAGICQLSFNLSLAKLHFERAFSEFRIHDDVHGLFAAWCGAVESLLHGLAELPELDYWIVTLDELLAEHGDVPPSRMENHIAAAMFMSLVFRQPGHPRFSYWKEKTMDALVQDKSISLRIFAGFFLLSHSYWTGDLGMAAKVHKEIIAMAESPDAQPLARTLGYFAASWHGWMEGDYTASLTAIEDGIQLSEKTGVVIWNQLMKMQGAISCLSEGEVDKADKWLDPLAENLTQCREFDIFYYHNERAWQALLRGKFQEALAYQKAALINITKVGAKPIIGVAHFGMSQIYHELGKFDQRDYHLAQALLCAELCNSRILEFRVGLARTQYYLEDGDNERASELLKTTMAVGKAEGYYNFTFWRSSVITPLAMLCLQEGIELEYVQKLIQKRKLRPQHPPVTIENWPWPLRIYTLGRFSVLKNGVPLVFGKKASIKVLELLKALIACGGRDVSEDRLSDLLWPDSDGDAAHQALATTLFRLRKWLGVKNAVIRSEGLMSLDPYSCWVDAWSLERLLGQAAQSDETCNSLSQKASAMYSGHFLAEDMDKSWATVMRERLRGKLTRTIETVAEELKEAQLYKESISWYSRGIELDPLAEELYQGLMKTYSAMGETSNALRVYDELQSVLLATFNLKPSETSQAICKTSINKKN
jgi:ATP/maltotriose-dependent transcriptional regulator MalT/DNA-binding SARP family transcriptional activator